MSAALITCLREAIALTENELRIFLQGNCVLRRPPSAAAGDELVPDESTLDPADADYVAQTRALVASWRQAIAAHRG